MNSLLADVVFAWRRLSARRRFVVATVTTLALGTGANASAFGLASWLLLRPVPGGIRNQGDLVRLRFQDVEGHPASTSYPNLRDMGDSTGPFAQLAGVQDRISLVVNARGESPRYLQAAFVSANYFRVLGVPMALGRSFTKSDEAVAPRAPAIILSDRFWRQTFQGNMAVVGSAITVNGVPGTIIGVAPEEFHGIERMGQTDLWIPATAVNQLAYRGLAASDVSTQREQGVFPDLVGRLKPGISLEQAQARIRADLIVILRDYPQLKRRWTNPTLSRGIGIPPDDRVAVRRTVALIGGVTGIILLIACINVASLFLAQGARRKSEWAIRRALGASTQHVLRLQFVEAALLVVLALAPSILVASLSTRLFDGSALPFVGDLHDLRLDWRTLAFTALVSAAVGILVGLIPAVVALRVPMLQGLRMGELSGSPRKDRLRSAFAVIQVALSLSLLISTYLLVGTVRNLGRVDLGFDADSVATFALSPTSSGLSADASLNVFRQMLERARATPGIRSAALTAVAPFAQTVTTRALNPDGPSDDPGSQTTLAWVSPEYFRVMGIRLEAGRVFRSNELYGSMSAGSGNGDVILSRNLAHRLFGSAESALGRRISLGGTSRATTVVGIVSDSRWNSLTNGGDPIAYLPVPAVIGSAGANFVLRTSLPLPALRVTLDATLGQIVRSVPILHLELLRTRVASKYAEQRLIARLLTGITILAILVVGVGLYSLATSTVVERERELCIRMALGASSHAIISMVLSRAAVVGGIGIIVGLAGAMGLARMMASLLYGLRPTDPWAYAVSSCGLALIIGVATIVPARRAARLDTMRTWRAE